MSEVVDGRYAFLAGGGEMGARVRAHDWAATPLGPPEAWPSTLKMMASLVLNSALLGTILWGPELRMIYNDAYAPALMEHHPDALGRPIADVWGAVWDTLAPSFLRVLTTGEPLFETRFELPMQRHGRQALTYWSYSVSPIRDEDGTIVGLLNQAVETTGERRIEQYQQRAEGILRDLNVDLRQDLSDRTTERDRLWATTTDLMGTATVDGHMTAVNPAWSRLLGWTDDELLTKPFAAIIHPDDQAAAGEVVAELSAGKTITGFTDRLLTKDGGERTVMWTATPDPELGSGLFHVVGRDMTDQLKAEAQLRQSQKMEAVGQLTGGLAHDFNNLLAGISGGLELMAIRISQGRLRDVEKYMVAAQGAARRAAALTHRLLAFSRQQTLAPKATDINALVNGMLELIQRTVGPGIHVDVVTVSGLWPALVDAPQLENALLNLCINARDAMPEGGSITIETANRWMDRHAAKQQDVPEGQYLSLCVSDTGTGMPAEVVAKAFDPFFTTKPIGQGTGLGLSMIYGFARQSGGQVRIYSEPDQGTMVCIYLPRHRGEAEADVAGPERLPVPVAEAGETVLVVDDEPTVRMLVTDVLEDLGYTAIEAADSAGGLRVLQSDARIDLLVSDVGLPGGMNGRQMVDAARVSRPDLRVLFITGFAENALLNNGQLEPGMSVLTKPFAVDTLAARIRELIVKQ